MSRRLIRAVLLLLATALAGNGNAAPPRNAQHKPVVAWPTAPNEPLYRYVYTLRTQADAGVTDERNAFKRLVTGARDVTRDLVLDKPVAVAARNGRVLVADSAKKMVVVFDIPRRRVYPFGVRDGPGRLKMPVAIAIDGFNRAYVVDATARRVNVYDDMGLFLHSVGSRQTLERPTGIAVNASGESICVVDRSSDDANVPRIVCFDAKGAVRHAIGSPGHGPAELNIPLRIATDDEGFLYVLDAGNFRVQIFDKNGKFVRMFGKAGSDPGTFSRPRGIAVDKYIYVADAGFGNVQVFDKTGRALLVIGTMGKEREENFSGEYILISDVAVDELGQIYIADQYSRKVEIIKPVGTPPELPPAESPTIAANATPVGSRLDRIQPDQR